MSQQVRSVRSGVGTYARILLEGLGEEGVECAVATWSDESDREAFPAVEWIELGDKPAWDPTPGGFLTLGTRAAGALAGRVGRNLDLVHFLDAREAHAWKGGRAVGTVHDDYAAHAPRSPLGLIGRAGDPLRRWAYYTWLRRLEARAYSGLSALMANSSATAQTLTEHYGVATADVHTVHLCVEPPPPAAPLRLLGSPALLFAGGNWYRKGLDVLVRALPSIARRLPGVHLHVAGRDGAARKILALAGRLGMAGRMTLHGRVDPQHMAAMTAAADAFVMPSRREALGLVYLEAFHAGTAVVAGRDGGVTDIVVDGVNGLTVPAEQPDALAETIVRLAGDEALRRRLLEGGRHTLAERTGERLLHETLAVYDEVTSCGSWTIAASASSGSSASQVDPEASCKSSSSRRPIALGENVRS